MNSTAEQKSALLYVDDDPRARRAFRRALKGKGFEIDLAGDAQEAIRMTAARAYSVVITDLKMPGMSGLALIKHLQGLREREAFIILTGAPHIDLNAEANSGASVASVLAKPWEVDELIEVIERAERRTRPVDLADLTEAPADDTPDPILIVEDNPADADYVKILLRKFGHRNQVFVWAERIDEALEHLHERRFSLLITDLALPDARGIDAVVRLQRAAPSAPIVVLSGLEDEDLALQALEHGAQDVLVKGRFDRAELYRVIRHAKERKRAEQRLARMAHFDELTGLANRTSFRERSKHALAMAKRRDEAFAIMMLDLDRFKAINDTLGHDAGDLLLQEVSARVQGVVRDSDTVARLGGDEFAVLVESPIDMDEARKLGERILVSLRAPVQLGTDVITVTSSLGVAVFPGGGRTIDALVTSADNAMYTAKRSGRNAVHVFCGQDDDETRVAAEFADDVAQAVASGSLALHYQPQICLQSGRLTGFEALLRWDRPGYGPVSPNVFVPILESSGLILEVGRWVLREACEQLVRFRESHAGPLRMAVNLSPMQFEDVRFVDAVDDAIAKFGLDPSDLELEITEGVLVRDTQRTNAALADLKTIGTRIAIDDFGTGHSSLSYLTRFSVDVLKIDRSFVTHLGNPASRDRHVAAAVIALAHNLGLEVVAEGVETEAQLAQLRADGCDRGQGYLLGRPGGAVAAISRGTAGRHRFSARPSQLAI